MPQPFSAVPVHLAFSIKSRVPFLGEGDLRGEVHAYLGGVSANLECPPVIVGGAEDHVHLLCYLGRRISQADWVKEHHRKLSFQDEYRVFLRKHGIAWDEQYVWD